MSVLTNLEPQSVWKHFEKLSSIPRASGKEAAAREYARSIARSSNLETLEDPAGNLVVRKSARSGRELAPMALLQAHLDMVCEKNEGTVHDFEVDPIRLLRNGDWLSADGTTLGADNGVGVAAALRVMESTDITHGPLEFAFTIEEETGLSGASQFPPGLLESKYLLNLDSEDEGQLCIGCAGGINTVLERRIRLVPAGAGSAWRIKVSGLRGGHSGIDIHQGRGNALQILGGILRDVLEQFPLALARVDGGSAHNAIPREAAAVVVLVPSDEDALKSVVAAGETAHKGYLGAPDSLLKIGVERAERPAAVLHREDMESTVALLTTLPHGVLAMSPDVPDLVETSTNLATVKTKEDVIEIVTSQRSAIARSKMSAARMVATTARLAGFEVVSSNNYPGWKPEPNNDLVQKLQEVHRQLFGHPAKLMAMHAGLECGVIGEKYPGMQLISFGPTIVDAHGPHERVKISSVQNFWAYLKNVLESL